MAALLEKTILCPVLIGRTPYLNSLSQRLEQIREGQGQVILLAGEAGIGKSRLAAETKALARQGGFTVLQGNCFEPDRVLPYAPWLDLLRGFVASHDETALHPFAPELIKLLPELGGVLPEMRPTPVLEPEQEKRRHFQTLTQFLIGLVGADLRVGPPMDKRMGKHAGLPLQMIVIEDLHWCDDTSLEFLLYFARHLVNSPILLLLTYRSDEPTPGLTHFLAELDRARLAAEFTLARLPADDVERMIRAIFEQAQPVRAEFTEAIHSLADGNPFFIEETLKALVASGDIYLANGIWTRKPIGDLQIPRTVQDAVQRRIGTLSEPARRLLALAAVAGRRFDFAVLQLAVQQTEGELLKLVRELVVAQLVVEEAADHFVFRHALTRQAIYSDLLGRERRALHRRVAEAMEGLYAHVAESHLAELALHFYEAGVWERALAYSRRAGEKAQALYTPRAAQEHYAHAIESARQLAVAVPVELYRARGQMNQTLGDFEAARDDFQAMLDEARGRNNRQAEWQALLELGFLWAARDYTRTGQYFRQALELARALDDSATLAHNLNRMGNWHLNIEQPLEALSYHREALRIFELLGDKAGLAATLDLLGIANYVANDTVSGVAYYERAIALFRELNDRGGLMSSLMIYSSRGTDYLGRTAVPVKTTLAERLGDGELALQMAQEIGARPGEALGHSWLGLALATAGEYGRALPLIRKGLALAEEIEHRHFMATSHLILGALHWDILALPTARLHLEQAVTLARETASMVWMRIAASYLVSTYVLQGQAEAAEKFLNEVLTPDLPAQAVGQRQLWFARAELLLAQGKAKEALAIVEQLIASAPNVEQAGEAAISSLALLRGEALMALGRMKEAEAVLLAGQRAAQEYERPPMQWRLHLALGKLYLARGQRDDAAGEFSSVRVIIEALAGKLGDAALRENFVRSATAGMGRATPDSPRRKAKKEAGGLTGREREVAALIAQGKSNREIAGALVLSPRTVEVHIANIMSKLGAASRAQIAAWVVEHKIGSTKFTVKKFGDADER
ncbi:MAG: AAA family ATPase [Chloroflexi bacterium]|nr:AAA family ATPase [Chloroflexota bacterium]